MVQMVRAVALLCVVAGCTRFGEASDLRGALLAGLGAGVSS